METGGRWRERQRQMKGAVGEKRGTVGVEIHNRGD